MRIFLRKDYPEMSKWFEARGQKPPPVEFLPASGMFVPGVAAGFLIITDCRFGILDFFITNGDVPKKARAKALHDIATSLVEHARSIGMKFVKCDTRYDIIKDLAIELHFSYYGESSCFAREL